MELQNYTVKFIIDDYISQVISLSDNQLNYSEAKKIVLNALASDDCAKVISDFYHNIYGWYFGREAASFFHPTLKTAS